MRIVRIVPLAALCLAACVAGLQIGASPAAAESAQEMQAAAAERTIHELERVRDNPLALHDFLKRMPKGADLHNHMHSAVYAETFIKEAIEDGLCVDPAKNASSGHRRRAAMRSWEGSRCERLQGSPAL